jgi:uncharacterized protein YjbI with pentapeptide repeats
MILKRHRTLDVFYKLIGILFTTIACSNAHSNSFECSYNTKEAASVARAKFEGFYEISKNVLIEKQSINEQRNHSFGTYKGQFQILESSFWGISDFDYSKFEGEFGITDTIFVGPTVFSNSCFYKGLELRLVYFESSAEFNRSEHNGPLIFSDVKIKSNAIFGYSTILSDLVFTNVAVNGDLAFSNINSTNRAIPSTQEMQPFPDRKFNITNSQFNGIARFNNSHFRHRVDIRDSQFLGKETAFSNSIFYNSTEFRDLLFEATVDFSNVKFRDKTTFKDVTFKNGANFKGADLYYSTFSDTSLKDVDLSKAKLFKCIPSENQCEHIVVADFRGAKDLKHLKYDYSNRINRPDGIIQVRDRLRESGFEIEADELTFFIENGKVNEALQSNVLGNL